MIAFERLIRCLRWLLGSLLLGGAVADAGPLDGLVASWAIRIDGDEAERTLRIVGAQAPVHRAPRVFAMLGPRGQRLSPVAVELGEQEGALALRFTTVTSARYEMRQVSNDRFVGQVTTATGVVRPVQFDRMAPGEDTAVPTVHHVSRPGPDVPADCAALSGLWEGEW